MDEDQFFGDKPQSNILVQIIHRYLPFWPLLVILLAVSLSFAFIYLRSQTKIYVAAAKVLLKDPQKGGGDSKVLDALNIFSEKKIVENEILVLRSTSIMQEVVKQLDLYTSIFNEGKVQTEELYGTNSPLYFEAINKDSINGGGKFSLDVDWKTSSIVLNKRRFKFTDIVEINGTNYRIIVNNDYNRNAVGKNYHVIFNDPASAAGAIVGGLNAAPISYSSTVIDLNIKTPVPEKGIKVLNKLFEVYNIAGIKDKNEIAQRTLKFVDDIVTPPAPGEAAAKPRCERIGGMLELAGGQFNNLEDGICQSGDVCALIGLKSVVTGDTIMLEPKGKGYNKRAAPSEPVYLAGVSSPKPVLKVRLEAESADQQTKLSAALLLLAVEDPSLMVEENDSTTLLSGLGELHIEVTLDRLQREHGLDVTVGKPAVSYRESLSASLLETEGLVNYDRTFGATRMQAAVHLRLESIQHCWETSQSSCVLLSDPVVTLGSEARAFLKADLDDDEDELMERNGLVRALILGCQGALKRGPLGSYAMSNMSCHIVNVHAEGGLSYLESMPGALRAGAANAMAGLFSANKHSCSLLEPTMSIEVIVPSSMVGMVLSDLTGRRGHVSDVHIGDGDELSSKALIRGEVPLVEILGYANSLRSLTAGEGAFTAEYKGHSPCDDPSMMSR